MGMNMETKKSKLFIDCEEAKYICNKSQYNESSWWERFRLNLRLLYCSITRAYVVKNKKLTKLIENNDVQCMDNKKKQKLKTDFQKELNK